MVGHAYFSVVGAVLDRNETARFPPSGLDRPIESGYNMMRRICIYRLIYFMYMYTHLYIYIYMYIYGTPQDTFLWFLLVFAVNDAHFELIFLVAVLGHVLVDLWGVPYIYIYI